MNLEELKRLLMEAPKGPYTFGSLHIAVYHSVDDENAIAGYTHLADIPIGVQADDPAWLAFANFVTAFCNNAPELIAACEERDEKDKELARLRFRVKHGVWPPAGLAESEWEEHAQEWPKAKSNDFDKEYADALIRNFDAAIRRIATELTGQACGGVDTGDNINPETGEPYGPGGHTGWLLASEAKKMREERDRFRKALNEEQNKHAELQHRCYEGYPSASDGIFDHSRKTQKELDWLIENFGITLNGMMKLAGSNAYSDCPEHLRNRLEGKK